MEHQGASSIQEAIDSARRAGQLVRELYDGQEALEQQWRQRGRREAYHKVLSLLEREILAVAQKGETCAELEAFLMKLVLALGEEVKQDLCAS